jgi:hypothetical protein
VRFLGAVLLQVGDRGRAGCGALIRPVSSTVVAQHLVGESATLLVLRMHAFAAAMSWARIHAPVVITFGKESPFISCSYLRSTWTRAVRSTRGGEP